MGVEMYEAVVNGNEIGTYDPVTAIVIVTEFGSWELTPEEIQNLIVRKKQQS